MSEREKREPAALPATATPIGADEAPPDDEARDALDLDDEAQAALDEARLEGSPMLDEVDVRELLRNALAPPPGTVPPRLLRGVQRRIRTRSRGKFYGDGWSTADSPRSTYLITSLLMLLLIAFVFFVLVPWGGGALP